MFPELSCENCKGAGGESVKTQGIASSSPRSGPKFGDNKSFMLPLYKYVDTCDRKI